MLRGSFLENLLGCVLGPYFDLLGVVFEVPWGSLGGCLGLLLGSFWDPFEVLRKLLSFSEVSSAPLGTPLDRLARAKRTVAILDDLARN